MYASFLKIQKKIYFLDENNKARNVIAPLRISNS